LCIQRRIDPILSVFDEESPVAIARFHAQLMGFLIFSGDL